MLLEEGENMPHNLSYVVPLFLQNDSDDAGLLGTIALGLLDDSLIVSGAAFGCLIFWIGGMVLVPFCLCFVLLGIHLFAPLVLSVGLSIFAGYALETTTRYWHAGSEGHNPESSLDIVINTMASFTLAALLVLAVPAVLGLMVSGGWIPVAAVAGALPLCQMIAACIPPVILLAGGMVEETLTGSHPHITAAFKSIFQVPGFVAGLAGAALGGVLGGLLAICRSIIICMDGGNGAQLSEQSVGQNPPQVPESKGSEFKDSAQVSMDGIYATEFATTSGNFGRRKGWLTQFGNDASTVVNPGFSSSSSLQPG